MHANEYEIEKEAVLREESMSQGEYMSEAVKQYASAHGEGSPDAEWILSPFDTWERNPYYTGKPGPHPEDDCWYYMEEDEAPDCENCEHSNEDKECDTPKSSNDDCPF